MDSLIYGLSFLTLSLLSTSIAAFPSSSSSPSTQINSNSVLVALLDSHYTELAELVDKALLLQTLERAVGTHNLTILAPRNEALDHRLDPDFKRFLLEPRNLRSLQTLVLSHIIPNRIESSDWPGSRSGSTQIRTLGDHRVRFSTIKLSGERVVAADGGGGGSAVFVRLDDIVRPDGVIHGIGRLLVPRSVQDDFNRRRSLSSVAAVLPQASPAVDPRTRRIKGPSPPRPAGSPPELPISAAMAPGPSLAPAPAPGPGGSRRHFDGEAQVKDFIETLLRYGGYNEFADVLVNLTSLAAEMGRLVSEGYVITVLAPNDEAMAKLGADRLSEPGSPEQIVYYHIIPEYQTEESMYNSVRRFGRVRYDTLRLPLRLAAEEADGSVRFGEGDGSAYLFDPDIYTDGRISVQGIDGVLFPAEEPEVKSAPAAKIVAKPRRGKLLEVTCGVLGFIGQASHFTTCH